MKKLLIILLAINAHLYAQTIEKFSIDSGGAITVSGNLQVLYTIGEVNLQEYNINNNYISEGFIDNFIFGSLGINDEFLSSNLIRVFPNPTSEFIHIKTDIPIDVIEVYNILGSKILKTNASKINVSNLKTGVYLLKIFNGNNQTTKKIIIE